MATLMHQNQHTRNSLGKGTGRLGIATAETDRRDILHHAIACKIIGPSEADLVIAGIAGNKEKIERRVSLEMRLRFSESIVDMLGSGPLGKINRLDNDSACTWLAAGLPRKISGPTLDGDGPHALSLEAVVDVRCAVTRLATGTLGILSLLVVEDDAAVPSLDPGARRAFLVVAHHSFNVIFPLAHLFAIGHFRPLAGVGVLEKAAILGNESQVGHAHKELVKLLGLPGRHDVDNVAIVNDQIIENIEGTLGELARYDHHDFRHT